MLQEKVKTILTTISFPFQSCVDYFRTFRTFFFKKKSLAAVGMENKIGPIYFFHRWTPNTDGAIKIMLQQCLQRSGI